MMAWVDGARDTQKGLAQRLNDKATTKPTEPLTQHSLTFALRHLVYNASVIRPNHQELSCTQHARLAAQR